MRNWNVSANDVAHGSHAGRHAPGVGCEHPRHRLVASVRSSPGSTLTCRPRYDKRMDKVPAPATRNSRGPIARCNAAVGARHLMNRLIAIAILAGTLSACAQDPRNLTITEENQDSFMEELKDATLTGEEFGLITTAQMRRALATSFEAEGPVFIGKTVGDIIEEERAFLAAAEARQAEEDRLAAEAQAAADARVAELRQALTLTIFDKGFRPSDVRNGQFEDFILIQAAYENTSGKDIRAFRGSVQFADLFGKEIYTTTLTISDRLAAGANATWSGQIRYNQFKADQQALRNTALEDMNIGWRPASIMFADGTTIGEPPAE